MDNHVPHNVILADTVGFDDGLAHVTFVLTVNLGKRIPGYRRREVRCSESSSSTVRSEWSERRSVRTSCLKLAFLDDLLKDGERRQ